MTTNEATATHQPTPHVVVEDLTVRFPNRNQNPTTIVDHVSFKLDRGSITGLVGESGCGKSVTALAMMGLVDHAEVSGIVRIGNRNLIGMPEAALRSMRGKVVSMVFQEPLSALNPVLTIENQLAEIFRLHQGVSRKATRKLAADMLARVGLSDPERRLRQYPHQISGGMRQRVLIAMALACKPKLLIADEPTTALDVTVQSQILSLLRELQQEMNLTILFITHDLAVVSQVCQKVIVLYSGRIVESGTVVDLFHHPAHPYTRGLLDCLPSGHQPGQPLSEMPGLLPDPAHRPTGCAFRPRCQWADTACGEQEPPLEPIDGESDHLVRCIHPLTGAQT
ncbi:MAG: ABC transporter ATP-binding protein [Deltaproteobacteria bacterium]|nr:ABC transporter ATP-binding protein [Deltaproteobacteria bacterium]